MVIGLRDRCVPNRKESVADQFHEKAIRLVNARNRFLEIIVHQLRELARSHALGDSGEVRDVGEHNAEKLLFRAGLQQLPLAQKLFRPCRRKMPGQALLQQLVVEIQPE